MFLRQTVPQKGKEYNQITSSDPYLTLSNRTGSPTLLTKDMPSKPCASRSLVDLTLGFDVRGDVNGRLEWEAASGTAGAIAWHLCWERLVKL